MRALAGALAVLTLAACADERWVMVSIELPPTRGEVCVMARGPVGLVAAERYDAREANGTLTFVEGDAVTESVRLAARLTRGGRFVDEARMAAPFRTDAPPVALRIGACAAGEPAAPGELGTALGGVGLVAADADGDGIDEIYVQTDAGVRELDGAELELAALGTVADADGDCRQEVWGRGADGTVRAAGGSASVDAAGERMVFGDAGDGQRLYVAGPTGVLSVSIDGATRRSLSGAPIAALAAGDLDGDGFDEIVAGGEGGLEVYFGGEGGPAIAVGATPRGWTALDLALGDIDGDGDLDLVVAREGGLGVARNRGDGFLEAVSVPSVAPTRVRVGDVDGDCVDDVVAIGADGGQWLAGTPSGVLGAPVALEAGLVDATFAFVAGARRHQLVLLHGDQRVEAVDP